MRLASDQISVKRLASAEMFASGSSGEESRRLERGIHREIALTEEQPRLR
jgi:hypothetical protein